MKILHFIYDHLNNPWVGGGGAVRVYEIYRRLAEKGYKITVISGNFPGASDYKINDNFEYKFIGSQKNYIISTFSYAFMAWKLLKASYKDYDIIIEDFAPWNPIFSYKLQHKKRVVLQIQNYIGREILRKYYMLGVPFYTIERIYPKKFSKVIVLSEVMNERWHIKGRVIPQGIDRIAEYAGLGRYIAFLGRIDISQKGLDLLVEALKGGKNMEVLVAGDGKDREKFLKIIKDAPNIRYIGKVSGEEKYNFIKNAKFLIVPSRFEGQGIVVLESASMGKPVIVSDIPELRYAVDAGFGLSFKKEDPKDLKAKVDLLLNDEKLLLQMGRRGIEYAKNFTWDRIAQMYEAYLLEVTK